MTYLALAFTWSTLFMLLASACYGIMSRIHHGNFIWSKNDYDFWGNNSGRRKYRYPYQPPKPTLYYRINKLSYREKFPLSATLLVFVTDGFHLVQFFMIKLLALTVIFFEGERSLANIVVMLGAWAVGFNVTYLVTKK